jgi:predicted Zn-dependent protease
MKWIAFIGLIVCSDLNGQSTASNPLNVNFIHLENDYSSNVALVNEIESFYRLSINNAAPKTYITEEKINVIDFTNSVRDTASNPNEYFIFFTAKPIYIGAVTYLLRGFTAKKISIISSFKIRLEANSEKDFESILLKTGLHETGHLLGLGHCEYNKKCFMVSTLPDPSFFLNSDKKLCDSCSNILKLYLR